MKTGTLVSIIAAGALAVSGCARCSGPHPVEPLPHFLKVDERLYRGGQPSPEGIRQLAAQGVKTIVSLRRGHPEREQERREAEAAGLRWVSLPIWAWGRPTEAQIRQFLAIAADPRAQPVFVHCRLGKTRTGAMVASYRILHDGWTPQDAFAESRRLGLTPWNLQMRQLVFSRIPRMRSPKGSEE